MYYWVRTKFPCFLSLSCLHLPSVSAFPCFSPLFLSFFHIHLTLITLLFPSPPFLPLSPPFPPLLSFSPFLSPHLPITLSHPSPPHREELCWMVPVVRDSTLWSPSLHHSRVCRCVSVRDVRVCWYVSVRDVRV